ncbi:hypothetical protein THAOC_37722, partial [Thalassiosira oceanica]
MSPDDDDDDGAENEMQQAWRAEILEKRRPHST